MTYWVILCGFGGNSNCAWHFPWIVPWCSMSYNKIIKHKFRINWNYIQLTLKITFYIFMFNFHLYHTFYYIEKKTVLLLNCNIIIWTFLRHMLNNSFFVVVFFTQIVMYGFFEFLINLSITISFYNYIYILASLRYYYFLYIIWIDFYFYIFRFPFSFSI